MQPWSDSDATIKEELCTEVVVLVRREFSRRDGQQLLDDPEHRGCHQQHVVGKVDQVPELAQVTKPIRRELTHLLESSHNVARRESRVEPQDKEAGGARSPRSFYQWGRT